MDGGREWWTRAVYVVIWWLEDKDERQQDEARGKYSSPNHTPRDTPPPRLTSSYFPLLLKNAIRV